MITREYVHKLPGDEGSDLPWAYLMIKEGRITHNGKALFYAIGEVTGGCVCIGSGSVQFVHVPGYIVSWHKKLNSSLRAISIVHPIIDDEEQIEIKKIFAEKYPQFQVCFL